MGNHDKADWLHTSKAKVIFKNLDDLRFEMLLLIKLKLMKA